MPRPTLRYCSAIALGVCLSTPLPAAPPYTMVCDDQGNLFLGGSFAGTAKYGNATMTSSAATISTEQS